MKAISDEMKFRYQNSQFVISKFSIESVPAD